MFESRTHIDDLFKTWDELSSYVLGFWYADGWITTCQSRNKCRKRWCLASTDLEELQSIAGYIGYHNKLFVNKSKWNRIKPCYNLRVWSPCLFDFCYDIIGTTRKSENEIPLPPVPDKIFHHFVRGFFDGDGSIHYVSYKNRHGKTSSQLRSSFTAGSKTGNFLISLRDRIRQHIPISMVQPTGKNSAKIKFGQYDTMILCQWMYADCNIYFARKKAIWDNADHEKLANSRLYFSNKL